MGAGGWVDLRVGVTETERLLWLGKVFSKQTETDLCARPLHPAPRCQGSPEQIRQLTPQVHGTLWSDPTRFKFWVSFSSPLGAATVR